jgi:hypothetical protein
MELLEAVNARRVRGEKRERARGGEEEKGSKSVD